MKNWKTTIGGLLVGVPMLLGQAGINLGHLGQGDFLDIFKAIGAVILGVAAKDHNVTGGTVKQDG